MFGSPGDSEPTRNELARAIDAFLDRDPAEEIPRIELPRPRESESMRVGLSLGEFELLREVGAGSTGTVFEAIQRSVPGRRVAVKILRAPALSPRMVDRFRREIAIIGRLDHPAIVPVIGADLGADVPYYAMKYIAGVPLGRMIERLRLLGNAPNDCSPLARILGEADRTRAESTDGAPSSSESILIGSFHAWVARAALALAEGLQHAHAHGIVHRDVKPWNILVTVHGRPVLVDFGLACGDDFETLTVDGSFVGTLAYSSPEQVRGDALDSRSDVHSLGATIWELVSLQRPFDGTTRAEVANAIESQARPRLDASIPADLRTILGCAIARSPRDRYQTPGAFAEDLRRFLAGEPIVARPPGTLARTIAFVRGHPRWIVAGVVFVVLFAFAQHVLETSLRVSQRVEDAARSIERAEAAHSELSSTHGSIHDLYQRPTRHSDLLAVLDRIDQLEARFHASSVEAETLLRIALDTAPDDSATRGTMARLLAVRLRRALGANLDCLLPGDVRDLHDRLLEFDVAGEHRNLLCTDSWIRLDTRPRGAEVSIRGREEITKLVTPIWREFPEGSYVADISLAGYATARLPFVVRRPAAFTDPGLAARFHDLAVDLLPSDAIGEGWLHVPGGYGLIGDREAHWREVGSFVVSEREVSARQWLEFLTSDFVRARLEQLASSNPSRLAVFEDLLRVGGQAEDGEVRHAFEQDGEGRYRLHESVDPERPIAWADRSAAALYHDWLTSQLDPDSRILRFGFPDVIQWERAARGADGRRYPWGHAFDPEAPDVSPFGVRDLAGSLSEMTRSKYGASAEIYTICGSSDVYEDPRRRTLHERQERYQSSTHDVGLRVVGHLPDAWETGHRAASLPFHDSFERDTLQPEWRVFVGEPSDPRMPQKREGWESKNGRLTLKAGCRSGSNHVYAVLSLDLPARNYRIAATTRSDREVDSDQRNLVMWLRPTIRPTHAADMLFELSRRGKIHYRVHGAADPRPPGVECGFRDGRDHRLELIVRESRAEMRVWPTGEPRPTRAHLVIEVPASLPAMRFLHFKACNLIGMTVQLDDVTVEEIP